ncbi:MULTISPECIES: hypothetical protein [unclassified Providencia]|uniref:hypothetical protein n=1 Tax=unclassified Providencia TaxID=2633465 RepID=UPI002349D38A|nr:MULTISPECIES: hypothetical protein [unclassified Providencia]
MAVTVFRLRPSDPESLWECARKDGFAGKGGESVTWGSVAAMPRPVAIYPTC